MFVYAIVNQENQKVYIGKTVSRNLKAYLRHKVWSSLGRRYKGRSHLFAAMQKHPSHAWSIHPLISCLTTDWQLCLWEKALIYAFSSNNPEIGYNVSSGGEGFTGQLREVRVRNGQRLGRWAVESGHLARISRLGTLSQPHEAKVKGGRIGILKMTKEQRVRGGKMTVSRHFSRMVNTLAPYRHKFNRDDSIKGAREGGVIARCKRWNINRSKPCVCGRHL